MPHHLSTTRPCHADACAARRSPGCTPGYCTHAATHTLSYSEHNLPNAAPIRCNGGASATRGACKGECAGRKRQSRT